jgi:hypothetical protein
MSFDASAPEAAAWAEQNAARLVTDITNDTRAAIRGLVTEGFDNGVPPRQTAQLIRSTIGLTERDARAVMRRQIKALADGVDVARATAQAERYAAKLHRSRSLTIARTETMRASNEGQKQLWAQARNRGLLTGKEKKVWFTSDPCPICASLEGETVAIDQSFSIGTDPPAHPNCRCTIGMVP